jgi:LysM repeat protein
MRKISTIAILVLLLQLVLISASYAAPPAHGDGGNGTYHRVRYGETLFSIGRQYGVYPYTIAQVNGLRNPNRIYAGQVLYIPSSGGWNDCGGCGNCGSGCGDQGRVRYDGNNCNSGCDWGGGYDNSWSGGNGCNSGCDGGGGYDNSWSGGNGCNSGCDGGGGYDNSWSGGNGCNSGCDWGGGYDNSWSGRRGCNTGCDRGWQDSSWSGGNDCNSGCGRSRVTQGYGYDYAGYYYYTSNPNLGRYSYTCGYYYNCY